MKNEIHYKFMKQNKLSTKPIKAITTFNKVHLRTETSNTKKRIDIFSGFEGLKMEEL